MKTEIIRFIAFVVLVFALYNLFDVLFAMFVTHNGYQFRILNNLIIPVSVGVVVGIVVLFFDRKINNNKNEKE